MNFVRKIPISIPITITQQAWQKMTSIIKGNNSYAFMFSAKGGGCHGYNYNLETLDQKEYHNIMTEKPPPTELIEQDTRLIIEPSSEMLLLGTTIDYIKEDYSHQIFESKFIYTPIKEYATSCGCGVSFSPK